MLVLDVSRSIKPERTARSRNVLQQLIRSQSRLGLVAFSDIAYELLPPGTPSPGAALPAAVLRARTAAAGPDGPPPESVVEQLFRRHPDLLGLILAHDALVRAGNPRGSILLVSDLDTAPDDVPRVAQTFNTFRSQGVKFRIVALTPRADNLSLFQNLAGRDAFVPHVSSVASGVGTHGRCVAGPDSWSLIFIAVLVLVALAANEHWNGRLPVPRTQS